MLEKIKAIINADDFKLDAATIVELLNIILTEIFGFIRESEGWVEETTEG